MESFEKHCPCTVVDIHFIGVEIQARKDGLIDQYGIESSLPPSNSFFVFFFSVGDRTKCLEHTRQVLYH
jgi:hypothetical protein